MMSVYFLLLIAALAWIYFLGKRIKRAEARIATLEGQFAGETEPLSDAPAQLADDHQEHAGLSDAPEVDLVESPQADQPEEMQVIETPEPGEPEMVFGSGDNAIRVSAATEAERLIDDDPAIAPPVDSGRDANEFERAMGSRWAIWVGGLALALGGVFLVRYSIEQGVFGPAVRLSIAAAAGVLALIAGELIRRRDISLAFAGDRAAYVPGILTAAGSAILFAVVYAAHGLYEFIGPATSFVALAVISLATIVLSLRHGPLLAALGLAGSYVTPALVSSQSPNPWILFSYLAVVLFASAWLARIRTRIWIIIAAFIGTTLWAIGFTLSGQTADALALVVPVGSIILATVFIWERGRKNRVLALTDYGKYSNRPVHTAVVAATLIVLAALSGSGHEHFPTRALVGISIFSILGLAVLRRSAWLAALAASGLSASAFLVWSQLSAFVGADLLLGNAFTSSAPPIEADFNGSILIASAVFFLAGSAMAGRLTAVAGHAVIWAIAATSVPLAGYIVSVLLFADLNLDLFYGATALFMFALFISASAFVVSRQDSQKKGTGPVGIYIGASAIAVWAAVHLLSTPAWTGIALAVSALAASLCWRSLKYSSLGWVAVAFALSVTARFAHDPAVALQLSTTPVFNWLLPGYYVPAVIFGLCAWVFARHSHATPQRIMEGLSATATIAGAAVMIRHGMNDGVLDSSGPVTLGEQTLYTLLALGASATLMRLDDRAPSPVFRIGSMLVGYVGLARAVYAHAVPLNPLFNADLVGEHLLANLVTAGYLLPALGAAAVWWFARTRRPRHYVLFLGCVAQFFLVAWIGLAVRHFYNAPVLAHFMNPPASTLEAFSYAPAYLGIALVALLLSQKVLTELFAAIVRFLSIVGLLLLVAINLVAENPLMTNAAMGENPFLNLVVLGYLVPGVLLLALRLLMRGRSESFSARLAVTIGIFTGLFLFAWVSLTIRWFYQGAYIGAWKGAVPAETYTYSAVWLLLGIVVLVLGQKMGSRMVRMASAGLVTLTVVKVFLIDMSELEGVLRAFSFMGLGAALIGIGLFYQRIFTGDKR